MVTRCTGPRGYRSKRRDNGKLFLLLSAELDPGLDTFFRLDRDCAPTNNVVVNHPCNVALTPDGPQSLRGWEEVPA
jgi:hypothetical protein